jgi:hypothetical protein
MIAMAAWSSSRVLMSCANAAASIPDEIGSRHTLKGMIGAGRWRSERRKRSMIVRVISAFAPGAALPELDHALVAHFADLVLLQPEQVAENLVVLCADGFAEPLDFTGCGGEPRHDVGNGDGAGA